MPPILSGSQICTTGEQTTVAEPKRRGLIRAADETDGQSKREQQPKGSKQMTYTEQLDAQNEAERFEAEYGSKSTRKAARPARVRRKITWKQFLLAWMIFAVIGSIYENTGERGARKHARIAAQTRHEAALEDRMRMAQARATVAQSYSDDQIIEDLEEAARLLREASEMLD